MATEELPVALSRGLAEYEWLKLDEGESLAIVGESGSGKSVLARTLIGIVAANGTRHGRVTVGGRDIDQLTKEERKHFFGVEVAMVFQDPMTSLNPLLTVGLQLGEVLSQHEGLRGREARKRCAHALGEVGIPNPEARLDAYPHELSGGMRQRVMIAMGLLCNPEVLIAD